MPFNMESSRRWKTQSAVKHAVVIHLVLWKASQPPASVGVLPRLWTSPGHMPGIGVGVGAQQLEIVLPTSVRGQTSAENWS